MKVRSLYVEAYQFYKQRPNWIFQAKVRVRMRNVKTDEIVEGWLYSQGFKRFDKKFMFEDALEKAGESWEIQKIYTAKYDVIKEYMVTIR